MIILDSTTKSLEVVLGGAVASTQADLYAAYVDHTSTTFTPGASDNVTNSATPVTIVAAPGASTQRQLKALSVLNQDSASIKVTVRLNNNGTIRALWSGSLLPGESLAYMDGVGFEVFGSDGRRQESSPSSSVGGVGVVESAFAQRTFRSALPDIVTLALSSGTAYWVYIGRFNKATAVKYVRSYVTGAGSGTQAGEVALASSVNPPNKAGQTLTKLAADGNLDALTGTGMKGNTSSLSYTIPSGTHLWAGMRVAMGTTQPTCRALTLDMLQGHVLTTAGASALTGSGPWAGSIPAIAATGLAPDLTVEMD